MQDMGFSKMRKSHVQLTLQKLLVYCLHLTANCLSAPADSAQKRACHV